MDISPTPFVNLTLAADQAAGLALALKVDQLISARVIDTLTLNIAGKTVTIQPEQLPALATGQSLQLQVVKLQPTVEFKIVDPPLAAEPAPGTPEPPPQLSLHKCRQAFMDIKLPLNNALPLPTSKTTGTGLDLKLGQLLQAKVVDTQIMLNTLSLKVADKTLLVQPQQPLSLPAGQALQLQVVKLLPAPEFKILPSPAMPLATAGETTTLRLLNVAVAIPTAGNPPSSLQLNQLVSGQQLQASVIEIANNKITLQLAPPVNDGSNTAPALTGNNGGLRVTLDARQLLLPTTASPATAAAQPGPTGANPATTQPGTAILSEGAQLQLRVVNTGNTPTFAVSRPVIDSERTISEAFRQLLPIQASSTPLLNHLQQLLPDLDDNATVADTLKRLAQDILRDIPLRTQLAEPTRLKQAISESGLFLESKLAQLLTGRQDIELQGDLKLKLGKWVELLGRELATSADTSQTTTEVLKEGLQKAHAALAKMTLDQLNSLPRDESPKQGWTLELPFMNQHNADSVHIEIEQDKTGGGENREKNWAVSITITPPDLATIHCRISCYDGSINTRFWSEAADTVEKINTHLDYLKQQFEQKGLTTGFMDAHQGKPTTTDTIKKPLFNLLSEKA